MVQKLTPLTPKCLRVLSNLKLDYSKYDPLYERENFFR
jgi:hypothetical protein